MSALSIRNMNWTVGVRESEWNEALNYKVSQKILTEANVAFIYSKLSPEEYTEWVNATPDGNDDFYLATELKVKEILLKLKHF